MTKRIIFLGMVFYWVFSLFGNESFAIYELFDRRLTAIVRADEYLVWRQEKHSSQEFAYSQALTLWRHRFQSELLFKLVDQEDTIINFYTWINFYYEAQPSFNENIRNSMESHQRHFKYQLPFFHYDDFLQECYLDVNKGPWTVRMGKQTVIWGDMTLERTTDVVNPLDLRYSTPGIDEFDELKIAIYMLRTIYQTSLPGNLIFELIVNPGDYERTRTGIQGSDRGAPPVPNPELGGMGLIAALDEFKDRLPRFAISNWAAGLRVRSQLRPKIFNRYYDFLVNMQYYTGLDNPIIDDLDERSKWIGKFMRSRANGKEPRSLPSGTFYDARRYEMIGLGIQTEEPDLLKSIILLEAAYFWGLDFNTTERLAPGETSYLTKKPTEINFFTYGLSFRRPTKVMFLKNIDHTARGIADMTFTIFQGWFLTSRIHEIKKPGDFSYGNRSETTLTYSFMTDFFTKQLTFVTNWQYNTRNWGYYTLSLTYSPVNAWKFTVGTMQFWANNPTDSGTASSYKSDRIYMKIRYEF